ncbi:MAG: hypothetical protein GEV06_03390 [Luteitalea sp.]|nr:hypothetical protein [Luteitalea sp.]
MSRRPRGIIMDSISILWHRLDQAGHEAARLIGDDAAPRLEGTAVFVEEGRPCRLDYRVSCDAAWFHFPAGTLEVLDQVYERIEQRRYRYESGGGAFVALLETNTAGFVVDYPQLWQAEVATPT